MSQMFLFSKSGIYREIIEALGRWKILECRNLHKLINTNVTYETLKRRVRILETQGVIESKYFNNKLKYIFLTDLGLKYTGADQTFSPKEEELTHDIICSKVVQELFKYSNVIDANMYHQIKRSGLNPDAELIIQKENEYKVALEIELTQKSQRRIKAKFEKYAGSAELDYCVFITNKQRIIDTYSRFLREMKEPIQEKFFFVFGENLLGVNRILDNSQCSYQGEKVPMESLFGKKIDVVSRGISARSQNMNLQKTQYF